MNSVDILLIATVGLSRFASLMFASGGRIAALGFGYFALGAKRVYSTNTVNVVAYHVRP
jgi:hypothetical protein